MRILLLVVVSALIGAQDGESEGAALPGPASDQETRATGGPPEQSLPLFTILFLFLLLDSSDLITSLELRTGRS